MLGRAVTILLCSGFAAGGVFTGCGEDQSESGSKQTPAAAKTAEAQPETTDATTDPKTVAIAIKDSAFVPGYVTARLGQTVVWTNQDEVRHTVKAAEGQYDFASKSLAKGATYKFKLDASKEIENIAYHCTIHPTMKGGIVVTK